MSTECGDLFFLITIYSSTKENHGAGIHGLNPVTVPYWIEAAAICLKISLLRDTKPNWVCRGRNVVEQVRIDFWLSLVPGHNKGRGHYINTGGTVVK